MNLINGKGYLTATLTHQGLTLDEAFLEVSDDEFVEVETPKDKNFKTPEEFSRYSQARIEKITDPQSSQESSQVSSPNKPEGRSSTQLLNKNLFNPMGFEMYWPDEQK